MAEATLEMPAAEAAAATPARAQTRPRIAPIVPERSVAGRTLVLLIAIMTFLSGVTLGGVVLVQKSAIAWSSDVGREVTIQIRPVEGEVMDSNIRTAIALAEATPGVTEAHALSLADSEKLLEPWLGAGLDHARPGERPARLPVRPLFAGHRWHRRHRRGGAGDCCAHCHHLARHRPPLPDADVISSGISCLR